MPLPDRFDLMVARARREEDPERQVEWTVGALFSLNDWWFLNVGEDAAFPAIVEEGGIRRVLVFSSADKMDDFTVDAGQRKANDPLETIAMALQKAVPFCLGLREWGVTGLDVNPGRWGFVVTLDLLAAYREAWEARGGALGRGYWIANTTSEEDDFWQEHGVD